MLSIRPVTISRHRQHCRGMTLRAYPIEPRSIRRLFTLGGGARSNRPPRPASLPPASPSSATPLSAPRLAPRISSQTLSTLDCKNIRQHVCWSPVSVKAAQERSDRICRNLQAIRVCRRLSSVVWSRNRMQLLTCMRPQLYKPQEGRARNRTRRTLARKPEYLREWALVHRLLQAIGIEFAAACQEDSGQSDRNGQIRGWGATGEEASTENRVSRRQSVCCRRICSRGLC